MLPNQQTIFENGIFGPPCTHKIFSQYFIICVYLCCCRVANKEYHFNCYTT